MEQILKFKISIDLLKYNINELANTIRTLLYIENSSIYEIIDIDNSSIFLEPDLFNYFNSKENGIVTNSIFQILWGYIPNKLKPEIEVDTKEGGVFNIPQFGYFKYTPNQKLAMCWDRFNNKVVFKKMGVVIDIEKHFPNGPIKTGPDDDAALLFI